MSTELFLVRHGEARSNVEPVIGGMRGDAGLTDRGRAQAQRLQEHWAAAGWSADQLYASTLPRALETAGHVAAALRLPVQHDDELHELRPGDADGLTHEQWRARYRVGEPAPSPPDPYRVFSPGGESWATFLARAGSALTRIVARHPGERVVVVCHAGVVEASFALAFGCGPSGVRVDCSPENTGVTHWRHRPAPGPQWRLVTFNDVAHLVGTGLTAG